MTSKSIHFVNQLDDNIIYQIIDMYNPIKKNRTLLFNHLTKINYDNKYISSFTGK